MAGGSGIFGEETMKASSKQFRAALCLALASACLRASAAEEPPKEWIDSDTGHRVIRLSREAGSSSLYFHQNAYSADGKKLVITTPSGLSTVNLQTRDVELVVTGRVGVIVTGRKTGNVYYTRRASQETDTPPSGKKGFGGPSVVFATDLDTKATREVVKLPAGHSVSALNSDESCLAGTVTALDPSGKTPRPPPLKLKPQRERMFPGKAQLTPEEEASAIKEDRLAQGIQRTNGMALFTVDTKTGKITTFNYGYDWLNHLQYSPTVPDLLMYCHEGTWHEVNRIWTVSTADPRSSIGTDKRLMHKLNMDMEIAGHEFWDPGGKIIWYDLQTPRSQVFWIAGINAEMGKKFRYKLERDQWSVHYNISPDGKLFAGDGGDPGQVAFAKDGQWINLFTPQPNGTLKWERLVNMAKHNYRLEPNVTFTPDGKWIVFRSNMHGPTHVYAVEVAKAK
jgi:oligogalacturonide lyase